MAEEGDEFDLPPLPSDDWEMTVFLKDIADAITGEDLKNLKFYLSGLGGSGKRVMESIKDPLDFFQHLRHRCLLNRNNILVLQTIIWHLGRKDLHAKLVKFSRERGNVLHFYNTSDKPVNGYEYLHFHVAGPEKMNCNKLEELRSCLSRYLCIPPEFVVTTDIKKTNSILITFMIPEGYSNILRSLKESEKRYLASMGIDKFIIDGDTIECSGDNGHHTDEVIKEDLEIKRLLEYKAKKEKEMEALQIQLMEKEKVVRNLQKIDQESRWKLFNVTGALIQQYVEAKFVPEKFSLQDIALRNAQKYFHHTLKIAKELSYDSDLINSIIEATALFNKVQNRNFHTYIVTQQNAHIRKLQHDLASLSYQRDKLAYHLDVGLSNPILTQNEEFFLQSLGIPLPFPVGNPGIKLKTEFGEFDLESMHFIQNTTFTLIDKIDQSLTKEEKGAIIKNFMGSSSKAYEDSKLSLLQYMCKWETMTKKPGQADFHSTMLKILSYLHRNDLIALWLGESCEIFAQAKRQSSGQQDQPSQRPEKGKRQQPSPSTERPQKNKRDDVNERLSRIEDMLKNLTTSGKDPLGSFGSETPFGSKLAHMTFGTDLKYDWSKLSQSKLFGKK